MSQIQPKIIITGATGWLGQNLVGYLKKNYSADITALHLDQEKNPQSLFPGMNVKLTAGDVTSLDQNHPLFKNAEDAVIIHLAGIIHPRRVSDFYRVNVKGTLNVLRLSKEARARRVVIMSSNSPIGCNPNNDHLFDESSPYNPYLGYGKSKMTMELKAKSFAQREGLEIVLIRAPWFYGPGQPQRQTEFFSMIKNGKVPVLGKGHNLRSMSYIENLAQGLALAAFSPKAANETYWLADSRPYSMNEIVDTIEEVLQKDFGMDTKHRRIHVPSFLGDAAYCADYLIQRMGLYNQKIHVLSEMNKTIACSIDKAKRELGYQPEVDLREGMRRSIQWCLDKNYQI